MEQLGNTALFFSFLAACAALSFANTKAAKALSYLSTAAVCLSTVALAGLFLSDNYAIQYVWRFSNSTMSPIYKVTAVWGGMDGSMLLWAMIASLFGATSIYGGHYLPTQMQRWNIFFINLNNIFFTGVVAFLTNPFRYLVSPFIPTEGNGLNPLLQNPLMVAHPPLLYLGFTGFIIPFAFALAALASNNLDNSWVRAARRPALLAWIFLTIGIFLGGRWAYEELGWGGFWAWDPVENSSFLPWLTGTAFIHSVIVQERKQMLKIWNIILIALTYLLTVFGTFLTRSGIVQSIHAFAETDIGHVFLAYIGLLTVMTAVLIIIRKDTLRSERQIKSYFSREAAFLVNNLLFVSICFAVAWGVMFPVFSEFFTGAKQTVGPPFFNTVTIPLFLVLIFLMAVGPLFSWERTSLKEAYALFAAPLITSFLIGVVLVASGINRFYPVLAFCLSSLVVLTALRELYRDKKTTIITRIKSRYEQYLGFAVHIGVAFSVLGITASMAYKIEQEFSLKSGESYSVGRYTLTLNSVKYLEGEHYDRLVADFTATTSGTVPTIDNLQPEKRIYRSTSEPTSEIALITGWRDDLYLVFAGLGEDESRAFFKVFINPLQRWLWIGGIIMALSSVALYIFSRQHKKNDE